MIIIAAVAAEGVIGHGGRMPWSIPGEYRHFLASVAGSVVIMGRKSFEEFGPDLTTSRNIVLTRRICLAGAEYTCRTIAEAVRIAQSFDCRVFCAGGAETYRQMMHLAEELWISHIHGTHAGDAFFPPIRGDFWRPRLREQREGYDFVRYVRRVPLQTDAGEIPVAIA